MQHKKFLYLLVASILILPAFLPILIRNVRAEPAPTLVLIKSKGKVGEIISINGTIDTENGFYRILFGGREVANGTADGTKVETEFAVPNMPAGTYNVTLFDVNASLESSPVEFTIETDYILDVYEPEKPYQLVEGDNVTISLTIKGGENDTVYSLNMTVSFQNETSYRVIELATNSSGYASENVTYPIGFEGAASTNYTGIYHIKLVKLNETVAEAEFTVGITELTEYHRGDTVKIHAIGYQSNASVTINVKFPNGHLESNTTTADPSGIIDFNWTVPMDAPMGDYLLWINNTKKYQDMQNFTVPGFRVIIPVENLNGEPVPEVSLEISENETGFQYGAETAEDGNATIMLERGNYTWKAIYKGKIVGEGNLTTHGIENETIQPLPVFLSTINVTVINEKTGSGVPLAQIKLFCNYTTVDGSNQTLALTEETGLNGTTEFVNVFVNESYIIEAYKYNALFNRTELPKLPVEPVHNVSILYPAKTLIVRVLDCVGKSAQSVIVKAYEWTNGTATPTDEEEINDNGIVTLNLTFGWYKLEVFKPTNAGLILLNETKADLTVENKTVEINVTCKFLGLNVTVRVVDFLGSPIPNVTVRLELTSTNLSFSKTGSGEFFFGGIIGGKYKILVFLHDSETPYLIETVYLDEPNTIITLKDRDHIEFLGNLMEVWAFATIIVIMVAAVITVIIIAYKRLSKRWISKEKV